MFTKLVYIFKKILLLQWTLILSICWHVALPILKLSRTVNFTGLKDDRNLTKFLEENLPFFFSFLFLNYDSFPSTSFSPICNKDGKKTQTTVYKQTLDRRIWKNFVFLLQPHLTHTPAPPPPPGCHA